MRHRHYRLFSGITLVLALPFLFGQGCISTDTVVPPGPNPPGPNPPGPTDEASAPLGLRFLDPDDYNSIPIATLPLGGTLPQRVDLSSDMPPAGNQGDQQSCVAWAVAYGLKSYQQRGTQGWDLGISSHQFSPSFVYNQTKLGDCNSGTYVYMAMNILTGQGCCTLDVMGYDPKDCSLNPTSKQTDAAKPYRFAYWRRINQVDPSEVKSHLAARFPIVIGMQVYENFPALKNEGVAAVYDSTTGNSIGGHCILVVGYDDTQARYKVLNSWGSSWGDNGYFYISYDIWPSVVREAYIAGDVDEATPPEQEAVETLTFLPPGGNISSTTAISISTKTEGAGIRYTLDGSPPSPTLGTVYTGSILISETTTITAIGYKTGMKDSAVASASYTYEAEAGGQVALQYSRDFAKFGVNYNSPSSIEVSPSRPPDLTGEPNYATASPLFGTIPFGEAGELGRVYVVVENLSTSQYSLRIDANRNRSLTDDLAYTLDNGYESPSIELVLDYGSRKLPYAFQVYHFIETNQTSFYRSCLTYGTVTLDGKTREIALLDANNDGLYRADSNQWLSDEAIIDLNGDGRADGSGSAEVITLGTPVILETGNTYRITDVALDGRSLRIVGSEAREILAGVVRNADTSGPVSLATISVAPGNWFGQTDNTGTYSMLLPRGNYSKVTVQASGYAPFLSFRSLSINAGVPNSLDVDLYRAVEGGSVTLQLRDSYHFRAGRLAGQDTGGDFSLGSDEGALGFWANNFGQQGVLDVGDMGGKSLETVTIPAVGYTHFGVPAIAGHTYVSMAREGEEGRYIVFRVATITATSVTVEWVYR